jgi:hypothetical protein
MRILVSCQQSRKRHPIPAYQFWRPYFIQGLQEAGHEPVEVPGVDWAEGLTYPVGRELEIWRGRAWQKTLDFVRGELANRPIDLFLCYLFPNQVDVAAIKELQQRGIPCVNFFCDAVREFRTVPPEFFAFALNWLPDLEAVPIYSSAKLPYLQSAYPCWIPATLREIPRAETEPPTFIGRSDALRREMFGRAIGAGADIVLRGPGWLPSADKSKCSVPLRRSVSRTLVNQIDFVRTHGLGSLFFRLADRMWPIASPPIPESNVGDSLSTAEYLRVTREAVVTVGINRVPSWKASNRKPLYFTRLRDIEAPMLGACYLTEWTETVGKLYEIGTEVEVYHTPEELCEKLIELKQNPQRRRSMRERAQRRALNDHCVARSVARIKERLGLSLS